MKLSDYNDLCVRITLRDGSVFEGACQYNDAEFNEAEIGPAEEGLEIGGWLFCRSEIEKVELIDESNPFRAPFGTIEEETVRDGVDAIRDGLIDGDERNVERLLNCLEHSLTQPESDAFEERQALAKALEEAARFHTGAAAEKCRALLTIALTR